MVQTASPPERVAGESRCGRLIRWFWVRVPGDPLEASRRTAAPAQLPSRSMRLRGTCLTLWLALALNAVPAHADLSGPSVPPPDNCAPTPLALVAAQPASQQVCVHRVLVTSSDAARD